MPEGPETHRAAARLHRLLQGQRLRGLSFTFPHLRAWEEVLLGQPVLAVRARGKATLIAFEDGHQIYSHNQLYGRWVLTKTAEPPTTRRQVRLSLLTEQGGAWLLSASEIAVLAPGEESDHPYLSKLGPDPLAPETEASTLIAAWRQGAFTRRRLGSLLLDQSFLAGVGNYLRSEILFLAGLPPESRLPASLDALAETAMACFDRSYRSGGLTCPPELVKELRQRGWGRRAYRHWVFGREGQGCHRCGETIERSHVQGRRLYRCPGCQPVEA